MRGTTELTDELRSLSTGRTFSEASNRALHTSSGPLFYPRRAHPKAVSRSSTASSAWRPPHC